MTQPGTEYLTSTLATFLGLKRDAERALAQVDDDAFFHALDAESNGLAVLIKHVGGNLRSRWTDFLTADGEKPTRDRDGEFEIGPGDTRERLMAGWEDGWRTLLGTIERLTPDDLDTKVAIRGESMAAQAAVQRALAHVAQHVGQIVLLSKHLAGPGWTTLTIPRRRR